MAPRTPENRTLFQRSPDGTCIVRTCNRGQELLRDPLTNKGSAFSHTERKTFGLEGLLPPGTNTIEEQVIRTYQSICRKEDPLERYIGLRALQDRNGVLFYRLLLAHLEEFMPIVYTPTVGQGCRYYSRILRRPRGTWITPEHKGKIRQVLSESQNSKHVKLIVVTDNERILGLGDQGVGGMGIPIGKLALYTACAGIHSESTLPVSLDVGTDNQKLLADELYLGWRHQRIRGQQYNELVEEFVDAVTECFPHALLQWEDFKKTNALHLLDTYRSKLLCFNDDIQGTAAISLAAVASASRHAGRSITDQRILIVGAGAAGIGIARLILSAMKENGLSDSDAAQRIAMVDSQGLLTRDRNGNDTYKKEFAWQKDGLESQQILDPTDLHHIAEKFRPTVLIGTSGSPGLFDKRLIETLTQTPHSLILPLSNPTDNSEGIPSNIRQWSQNNCWIATGSPFKDTDQANNVFVFPGVGLGAIVTRASSVTDTMFYAAATAIAEYTAQYHPGSLLPPIGALRIVSRAVAIAVAKQAIVDGQSTMTLPEVENAIDSEMWTPQYPQIVAD